MKPYRLLTLTLLLLGSTIIVLPAKATSPCPPNSNPAMLQLNRLNWVIAEVTIVESLPGTAERSTAASVDVNRVFYGGLTSQAITVADYFGFGECSDAIISNRPIGSRWIIGAPPRGANLYGGPAPFAILPVENGAISGRLLETEDTVFSLTTDEFAEFVTQRYLVDGPGTLEALGVATNPTVVLEGEGFDLVFSGFNLPAPTRVEVDQQNGVIHVPSQGANCFSAGNPPYLPNKNPSVVSVPVEGLSAGSYSVDAEWGPDCFGDTTSIMQDIYVFPSDRQLAYNQESPRAGETVSGVGVIRGWACNKDNALDIRSITFTIDDLPFQFPLPHGSERSDTGYICSSEHSGFDPVYSGYGGVFYWGRFANGAHTFTLYIDGEEMESFEFFVAQPPSTGNPLDAGFRKGASGEYVIDNFLGTDESVVIRWSEADQNFIIVEYN